MSDKKISQLPASTVPLAGTEELAIVQSGDTKKVSVANLTTGREITASDATISKSVGSALHFVSTATSLSEGQNTSYIDFYQSDTSGSGSGTGTTAKIAAVSSKWYNGGSYLTYFGTAARLGFFVADEQASTSLTERMSIVNSGLVGIGVTEPTQLLDVAGNIKTTGNLVIGTSGKGIDFSADGQAAGMTSELLDDYEEGTWTPTLPNGGTLTVQTASYTKIGRQVTVSCYVNAISPTNDSAQFRIGGLPFTSNDTNYYAGSIGYVGDGDLSGWMFISLPTTNEITFRVDTGSSAARTNADYITAASGSSDDLILTLTYFV